MAASDITILTLTATAGFRGNKIAWTYSDPWALTGLHYRLDAVEVWASTTNDRTTAAKVGEGVTDFLHSGLVEEQTYYYWAKARDRVPPSGAYGAFYPVSTTAGVSCVALGVSGLTFGLANGKVVASVSSNALTIAIKTAAGNDPSADDPVFLSFPSSTLTSGAYQIRPITAAMSVMVAAGKDLGVTIASVPFRLRATVHDDAGTLRLGVKNSVAADGVTGTIYPLRQSGIGSTDTTNAAGSPTGLEVAMTGVAVTSKSYRVIASLDWSSGLATPGQWSVSADAVRLLASGQGMPGEILQEVSVASTTRVSGATVTPFDNTKPQVSEGNSWNSLTITPTSACNFFDFEIMFNLACSVASEVIVSIFHVDAGASADAIAAAYDYVSAADKPTQCTFRMRVAILVGTARAYNIRFGAANAGTIEVNGVAGAGKLNGTATSWVQVKEVAA